MRWLLGVVIKKVFEKSRLESSQGVDVEYYIGQFVPKFCTLILERLSTRFRRPGWYVKLRDGVTSGKVNSSTRERERVERKGETPTRASDQIPSVEVIVTVIVVETIDR